MDAKAMLRARLAQAKASKPAAALKRKARLLHKRPHVVLGA